MALKGYELVEVKFLRYYFKTIEPQKLVYQFDFQFLDKGKEHEYLYYFEGWRLACKQGGWYYFIQEKASTPVLFNNQQSAKAMFQKIIGFLALIGFPLYYQILFIFPKMSSIDPVINMIYLVSRIFCLVIAFFHFIYLFKISMYLLTLNKDIQE